MNTEQERIEQAVQTALSKKSQQDSIQTRLLFAIVCAAAFGYIIWSKLGIFSLYQGNVFIAIGIGAVVGFFLREVFVFALIGVVGLLIYGALHSQEKTEAVADAPVSAGATITQDSPIRVTLAHEELVRVVRDLKWIPISHKQKERIMKEAPYCNDFVEASIIPEVSVEKVFSSLTLDQKEKCAAILGY